MKKFLAIILGALFVFSFAASAFAIHAEIPSETQAVVAAGATQITLGGELRVRGWWTSNINSLRQPSEPLPGQSGDSSWYDERVRLSIDAKVSPNVEGFVQLESSNGEFSPIQDKYNWGNFNSKPSDLAILQAWIMYSGSGLLGAPAGLKIGHMPLALGEMQFFDHTKFGDDAIVFFVLPTKELEIDVLTIKFAGDGAPAANTGIPTFGVSDPGSQWKQTDDLDGYVGIISYKLDDKNTIGLNYTYLNWSQIGFSHQDLGVNAHGNVAGLTYKGEVDVQFGKIFDETPIETDFRGWAVMVGLGYQFEPINLRASFGYGSGDDNGFGDGKDKQFETYLGNDQHYTLVYEYNVVSAAGRLNSGLSNTTYYNLGLDVTPIKDIKASVDGYILRASKAPSGISKDIGWEIDGRIVYNVAKNLTYQVDAGYLNTGSFYDDVLLGEAKNATVLRHALTLSF